jgi:hypothetical protein
VGDTGTVLGELTLADSSVEAGSGPRKDLLGEDNGLENPSRGTYGPGSCQGTVHVRCDRPSACGGKGAGSVFGTPGGALELGGHGGVVRGLLREVP